MCALLTHFCLLPRRALRVPHLPFALPPVVFAPSVLPFPRLTAPLCVPALALTPGRCLAARAPWCPFPSSSSISPFRTLLLPRGLPRCPLLFFLPAFIAACSLSFPVSFITGLVFPSQPPLLRLSLFFLPPSSPPSLSLVVSLPLPPPALPTLLGLCPLLPFSSSLLFSGLLFARLPSFSPP